MQAKYLLIFPVMLALALPASKVQAERAELIDKIYSWSVNIHEFDGKTICFVASRARKLEPRSLGREYVRAYISTFKGAGNTTSQDAKARLREVSILVGSPLKSGAGAIVQIDGHKFKMFGDGQTVFITDRTKEKALVKAMQKGKVMIVKAETEDGISTRDEFSLKGIAKALKKMKKVCEK